MSKLANIAEAIANKIKEQLGVADEATLLIAKGRREICHECDDIHFSPIFKSEFCKHCTCIIELKTLSPSEKCPISKW